MAEERLRKHLVIPDTQVRAGVPLDHLEWCGEYIVAKKPEVVVQIGDFADMPSLSSYDPKGSKRYENRRYLEDIEVAHRAMELLLEPLRRFNAKMKEQKRAQYHPRLVLTLGNHEDRITRAINSDPTHLDGLISLADLEYERFGWEVHPFLETVNIDGIMYSHYFTSGVMGRAINNAKALLTKLHMSCFAGHQQGRDIAYGKRADGRVITAIIAGSFYQHDEEYLNPQTNTHWRGIYVLHEVEDGQFDEMPVSLAYLRKKYSGKSEEELERLRKAEKEVSG